MNCSNQTNSMSIQYSPNQIKYIFQENKKQKNLNSTSYRESTENNKKHQTILVNKSKKNHLVNSLVRTNQFTIMCICIPTQILF